jgi:hypothetical protein
LLTFRPAGHGYAARNRPLLSANGRLKGGLSSRFVV